MGSIWGNGSPIILAPPSDTSLKIEHGQHFSLANNKSERVRSASYTHDWIPANSPNLRDGLQASSLQHWLCHSDAMKELERYGRLLYVVPFALGATSIVLGAHLQLWVERREMSSIPWPPDAVARTWWVAAAIMLLGLVVVSVLAIVFFRMSQADIRSRVFLKQCAVAFLAFVAGLIAGGTFLPVR